MAEVWPSASEVDQRRVVPRLARNSHRLCYTEKEMSMADSDITVEILKDIRDEIRGVRGEVRELRGDTNQRLDITNHRLEANTQRLDLVETTLLDLAEQQRFVVRYTKAISERDTSLEPRVSALETRVEKLESK
jgi:hypothetical protein